jgi:DNA-binding MarR family transcriptional regulator
VVVPADTASLAPGRHPSGASYSDDLGPALLSAVARLHRWATRNARLPVSPAQARLLAQIEELGPSRIGDLARADHCSQPTMSAQVHRLEQSGLAECSSDPQDARAVLVVITDRGRACLTQMRQARAEAVAPLLAGIDDGDRERLLDAVAVLTRLLEERSSPPGDIPPPTSSVEP